MTIHDWTRVPEGTVRHFSVTWLGDLAGKLNSGVLPDGYYTPVEQVVTGAFAPIDNNAEAATPEPTATLTATAAAPRFPPRVRMVAIRHVTGDRVVVIVEIVSPGIKNDVVELGALAEKLVSFPPLESSYEQAFAKIPAHLRGILVS